MTAHCTPVLLRPSSFWISGTAMDTMVWSMKVIETAKIIAARMRFFDPPPVVLVLAIPLLPVVSGGHTDRDPTPYSLAMLPDRFSGRNALVTGGASGIGRATALRLASEGAAVVAVDVNAGLLAELAAEADGLERVGRPPWSVT